MIHKSAIVAMNYFCGPRCGARFHCLRILGTRRPPRRRNPECYRKFRQQEHRHKLDRSRCNAWRIRPRTVDSLRFDRGLLLFGCSYRLIGGRLRGILVRQLKEHVGVAWRSRLAPARKVLTPQVFYDVRMVELFKHAPVTPEMLHTLRLISINANSVWVPPSPRPANADRVFRHPPAFYSASPDSFWCFVHGLGSVWWCLHGYFAPSSWARTFQGLDIALFGLLGGE